MQNIIYKVNQIPTALDIISVYDNSGIVRPTKDITRIEKMYKNSNLVITAWCNDELIGIARNLTDFSYSCYCSDLAVKKEFQHKGIGKKLLEITKEQAGIESNLLLLSATPAIEYYPKVGFTKVENAFLIKRMA